MNTSLLHKAVLLVSGATAVYIGGSVIASPDAFYAAYGISLQGDVSLTNELRASGGSVLMLGLLILCGAGHLRVSPWPRPCSPVPCSSPLARPGS
jgi:hypothetical protein